VAPGCLSRVFRVPRRHRAIRGAWVGRPNPSAFVEALPQAARLWHPAASPRPHRIAQVLLSRPRSHDVRLCPLDVRCANRIELVVDFGENGDMQDRFDWVEAALIR